ncbi:cytochrome P450 [Mycena epipterygia]|nr:cytochrome P450 [Mycena epipterygia]
MLSFDLAPAATLAAGALLWLLYRQQWKARTQGYPLPPGPPSKPLIGNILNVSPKRPWFKLTEYKKEYGDLVFFHGLGNNILVLNSMESVVDLLDKRGNIYSHRPEFTVAGELMALGQSMPLLPYGNEWRAHRKLAHVALSQGAVKQYHVVQEDLAALLNKAILDKPEDFFSHVRLAAQRIVLTVTYGLSVEAADNEYITQAEETMDIIGKATVPGAYLADLLPFLKHLPSFFAFHQEARHGKSMIEELVTKPYEHVKSDMTGGDAKPSLTQHLLSLEESEAMDNYEHRVKWTAGAMYGAGGETTYSTVLIFIMLMAMHPDVQTRVQEEVDRVVGKDRLPVIADRPDMPYLNAVIKETMRWHPVLPLSIARRTDKDDVYGGYFVPKGTTVLPNVWAIALQPDGKYDPEAFIPERFLDPEVQVIDPNLWAFGFGRRICPGQYLAQNSLFVLISNIAFAFDVSQPQDGNIEPAFGPNLVSYPQPFKCRIKPRSEAKAALVESRAGHCNV